MRTRTILVAAGLALTARTAGADQPPRAALIRGAPVVASVDFRGGPAPRVVIPDPASWAMMLLGFGVVGGLVRRRRKAVLLIGMPAAPSSPGRTRAG